MAQPTSCPQEDPQEHDHRKGRGYGTHCRDEETETWVQIVSTNRFPGILPLWEIDTKALFVFVCQTASHITWNGLELTVEPRITLNFDLPASAS